MVSSFREDIDLVKSDRDYVNDNHQVVVDEENIKV